MTQLFAKLTLSVADAEGMHWAQQQVCNHHYLRSRVDPRCRPLAYILQRQAWHGADAAAGLRGVGMVIVGRPEATRCYQGALTYGSLADVQVGRAQFDRWEVINIARVWLHPCVQHGGQWCLPDELPGYTDRRGVFRSTLASTLLKAVLARVGLDYLRAHPPVDCAYPYQLRAALSYCDTRLHRGTIYRAAGFTLARTNERGIETWTTTDLATLTADQDAEVRRLAERLARSQRIRAQRAQLVMDLEG